MDITTLDQFKDEIYGVKGTPRRDNLERELETLRIGVQIRNARQKKFPYILIDEFQDINKIQYEIVKMLAGETKNLFTGVC